MYTTRIAAIVALTLATASCGPEDRDFTLDPNLTTAQLTSTRSAARKWEEVLGKPIAVDGGTWTLRIGPTPAGFDGWTDSATRTVTISPGVTDEGFYAVVLHELGHSQGFFHHAGPGVMNAVTGATDFTVADWRECSSLQRC